MSAASHLYRWFPFLAWPRPDRQLLRGEFWAGMTVGLMLVQPGGQDRALLECAYAIERLLSLHLMGASGR